MKRKTPRLVIYAALSLITVLIWFGTEVLRNLTKKPETKVPDEVLTPLDPTLDQEALNKLENSLFFDPNQIVIISTPTPTATPFLQARPTPTVNPTTTPSGTSSPTVSPAPSSP